MEDEIYPGTCVLLPKPRNTIPHLWIVLTDIDYHPSIDTNGCEPPVVVVVNLTSYRPGAETTLILNREDHSFITKPTTVYYSDARFISVDSLVKFMNLPNNQFSDDCSEDLLKRIQQGLLKSSYVDREIKEYCREFFK